MDLNDPLSSSVIAVSAKQLLKFSSKNLYSKMKNHVDQFFQKFSPESIQDVTNQLINKIQELSSAAGPCSTEISGLFQQILNRIVTDTANRIKNNLEAGRNYVIEFCQRYQVDEEGTCIVENSALLPQFFNQFATLPKKTLETHEVSKIYINEFCQRNVKTIKVAAPLLILKCFDLIEDKGISSILIEEILLASEVLFNVPDISKNILDIKLSKNLWTATFLKGTHPTIKNCKSAVDMLLFDGISRDAEKAAIEIINLHKTDPLNKFLNVIPEFCSKKSPEFLRVGIMELICKIYDLAQNYSVSRLIVENFLLNFEEFVAEKGNEFKNSIFNRRVSPYLWEECCLIVLRNQNPSKILTVLDLLFHIREPDSDRRALIVSGYIKSLNNNEKDLWEQMVLGMKKPFSSESVHAVQEDAEEDPYTKVVSQISEGPCRNDILTQISKLSSTKNDSNLLLKILANFDKEVITFGEVFDDIWIAALKKCFELLPLQKMSNWTSYSAAFDLLFCVSKAESEKRSLFINNSLQTMLSDAKTFHLAVACIKTFNLKKLEEEEFENIVRNSASFKKENVFYSFFREPDYRLRFKEILGESNIKQKQKIEKEKVIKEFNKGIVPLNWLFRERSFLHAAKIAFKFAVNRRSFELYILNSEGIGTKLFSSFALLEGVLSNNKKYAYCWAKYFKMPKTLQPKFIKKEYKKDAKKFIEKMNNFAEDGIKFDNFDGKIISFLGKEYVYLYVDTPEGLFDFFMYVLKLNHALIGKIGIDCETDKNNNVSLLQLATKEWICLIDIQKLHTKISDEQWKIFFERLFCDENVLLGFSFRNDVKYLCKTFPFLQELFQGCEVECLQNFAANLLKNENMDKSKIFTFDETITPGSSLAAHVKAILNIELDKSEQTSNWSQRPLTDKQKEYAFFDALILILLKEELDSRLEKISRLYKKQFIVKMKKEDFDYNLLRAHMKR